MHPDEVGHAKNTGRLLHLCLAQSSRILTAEVFEPPLLNDALHGIWPGQNAPHRTALLYPETDGSASHLGVSPDEKTQSAQIVRLVIIDATWRKSRLMIHANPALQSLPRLALNDVPESRYAIRKAHAEHQLSTLEATHLALRQLEPGNAGIDALSEAMNALMALQRPFWPHAQEAELPIDVTRIKP